MPQLTSKPEDEILTRADALFRAEQSQDLRAVIAEKIEELRHYDVQAMERVVAICFFAKSGSLLLASYLDGHDDVLMLPSLCGTDLYKFFGLFPSLPLRDKLLCYAAHAQTYAPFFEGDFAISSAQYYAAVQAILEYYADWQPEFLESRRAFFLFVNIAYNLALGRRPASPQPLIVYPQHFWDPAMARKLVDDFPQAKFIHTIRDPITSCGQMLADRLLPTEPAPEPESPAREAESPLNAPLGHPVAKNPLISVGARCVGAFQQVVGLLRRRGFRVLAPINGDRPHFGMEPRTTAIRFEDLHCDTAATMRDLSDWLGLSYQPSLTESTFNGIPWVVSSNGKTWSGARPEQAQRNLRYISRTDQAVLFALFHRNFVAWNYPCPKVYGNPMVRCIVFAALFLVPMKIEILAARAHFKSRILPALRHGNISSAINSCLRIAFHRLAICSIFVLEFVGRCVYRKTLLEVGHGSHVKELVQ